MNFLRQPIERKLSNLLGMAVSIGQLDVAIFKGSATARNVVIGDDPTEPLLRVEAIRFDIAIGRALQKEIQVRSLTIEKPMLTLVRRPDGTWNLPRVARKSSDSTGSGSDSSAGDEGRWTFDLTRLLLVDGSVRLKLQLSESAGWELSADKVLGEIARQGTDLRFSLMCDALRAAGWAEPIGDLKLAGRLGSFETFRTITGCSLQASVDLGRDVRLTAASDRIDSGAFGVVLDAAVEVAELITLLPPLPALEVLRSMRLRGPVRLSTDLHFTRPADPPAKRPNIGQSA